MSTDSNRPPLAPWIMVAVAAAIAAGLAGYALARKQSGAATAPTASTAGTQWVLLEARQRDLEAQIRTLQQTVARLETKPTKADPAPPAADPALTAQLNALTATLAAVAEAQKKQLAAKPASTPPAPRTDLSPATPAPKPVPAALDSIQAAYRQAWETGQPVAIGQTPNPKTGQPEGGRVLDPAQAKALGLASWQEWYATEEATRRTELENQAGKEFSQLENKLVDIPKPQNP